MAGHSHTHDHGHDAIPWSTARSNRVLQSVLGLVLVAGVATIIGIIALWPTSEGQDAAISQGAQVGLGSARYAATVTEVRDGPCSYSTSANPQDCRTVGFEPDEGPFRGEQQVFQEFNLNIDAITPDVEIGDGIIAGYEPSTEFWFYADRDRRASLVWLTLIFAAVVIALSRLRGIAALAAMVMTVVVLIGFVAPSVLDGNDPLLVAVVAAAAIAFVSLYLTHGVSPTTTVALGGTLISLSMTLGLASVFFSLARFTGLATEEALLLPFIAGDIDLSALLLGGAVLGTLGALDDVTVTQVATVAELRLRSPDLDARDLVVSGIRVGREHIASTVNTLLLAYAGASMPLLLLFAASEQELDKVANAELISVEIVRTLTGSIGLVAAVPITTVLAALVISPRSAEGSDATDAESGVLTGEWPTEPPSAPGDGPSDAEQGPTEGPPALRPSWEDFAPDDDTTRW